MAETIRCGECNDVMAPSREDPTEYDCRRCRGLTRSEYKVFCAKAITCSDCFTVVQRTDVPGVPSFYICLKCNKPVPFPTNPESRTAHENVWATQDELRAVRYKNGVLEQTLAQAQAEIARLKSQLQAKQLNFAKQCRLDAQEAEVRTLTNENYKQRAMLLTLRALAPEVYKQVEEAANNPVNVEIEI